MKKLRTMAMRMHHKLKSKKGESITEVLVALLISALAIVLLAGMVNASTNMILKSKDKMEKYANAENSVVERNGNEPATGTVTFKIGENKIRLNDDNNGTTDNEVSVEYYTNDESVKYKVRSYKVK